jgi:hypothetical protein
MRTRRNAIHAQQSQVPSSPGHMHKSKLISAGQKLGKGQTKKQKQPYRAPWMQQPVARRPPAAAPKEASTPRQAIHGGTIPTDEAQLPAAR